MNQLTKQEYKKRIDQVIDYILKNLNKEIKLQDLAEIANYSPFHFQKLFKEFKGISPKQYVIKLKLETALHLMLIREDKTIKEIALDCGFSSPAVFSRAVKNQYGVSPEKFRSLRTKSAIEFMLAKNLLDGHTPRQGVELKTRDLTIEIVRKTELKGIYCMAPLDDSEKIKDVFIEIQQKAKANEIEFDPNQIYGIYSPHQGNIYKCFLAVSDNKFSKKFNWTQIDGGTYVCFKVKGSHQITLETASHFFHKWLPDSGYKIADIVGHETFEENPGIQDYDQIQRKLYVRVEAI